MNNEQTEQTALIESTYRDQYGRGNKLHPREYVQTDWSYTTGLRKALKHEGIRFTSWYDHPEIVEEDGEKIYISNPYHLYPNDLTELSKLESYGWSIIVGGLSAYRFNCIPIYIRRSHHGLAELIEKQEQKIKDLKAERKALRPKGGYTPDFERLMDLGYAGLDGGLIDFEVRKLEIMKLKNQ